MASTVSTQVGSVLAASLESQSDSLSGKGRMCNMCGNKLGKHLRRYLFVNHLPCYTDPTAAYWECEHNKDMAWHLTVTKTLGIPHEASFFQPCMFLYSVVLCLVSWCSSAIILL